MTDDLRIQRAAGIIMWHLARGADLQDATARATNREPDLSDEEVAAAQQWAASAVLAADIANNSPGSAKIGDILDAARVPWRTE